MCVHNATEIEPPEKERIAWKVVRRVEGWGLNRQWVKSPYQEFLTAVGERYDAKLDDYGLEEIGWSYGEPPLHRLMEHRNYGFHAYVVRADAVEALNRYFRASYINWSDPRSFALAEVKLEGVFRHGRDASAPGELPGRPVVMAHRMTVVRVLEKSEEVEAEIRRS